MKWLGAKIKCARSFCQHGISSTWHFVHLKFRQHGISSAWHISMNYCQLEISSAWHFVNLTFPYVNNVWVTSSPGNYFPPLLDETAGWRNGRLTIWPGTNKIEISKWKDCLLTTSKRCQTFQRRLLLLVIRCRLFVGWIRRLRKKNLHFWQIQRIWSVALIRSSERREAGVNVDEFYTGGNFGLGLCRLETIL